MTGSFTRTRSVWTLAILLLTASLLVGSVAASAGAASGGHNRAVVAKKKCKKKKKGVRTAKKRKCKHKVSIPGPIVRATMTWSSGQVDLHAFDASGARSGITLPCSDAICPITEGIPNATHSPDVAGGSETFTDNIFVRGGKANREFGYAVCFYDNASVSFTVVNAFGQTQTLPVDGLAGQGHSVTTPTGPQVPASFSC